MRKFMMLFAFVVVGSLSNVQAYVNASANCWINGGVEAVCEVCNNYYSRPIACKMNVRGITSSRSWVNSYQEGIIYPGRCANAFVRANNPYIDPIIDANVNLNCRF